MNFQEYPKALYKNADAEMLIVADEAQEVAARKGGYALHGESVAHEVAAAAPEKRTYTRKAK